MSNKKQIKKEAEKLWSKNKYLVLSKSQKIYLEIREYLKQEELNIQYLKTKINKAYNIKTNKKEFINAMHHIWGYFKKVSSKEEKNKYFTLLDNFLGDKISEDEIINFIKCLLKKYPNEYLQKSNIITGDKK